MAVSQISVRNGAVALPSGFNADFQEFEVTESQGVEDTTPFGANIYSRNLGTGTPTLTVTAGAWGRKGAASSTPGFGNMAAAGGDVGAAGTLTVDTGTTLAGSYIVTSLSIGISRIRAGGPCRFSLVNAGDITTTWPVA